MKKINAGERPETIGKHGNLVCRRISKPMHQIHICISIHISALAACWWLQRNADGQLPIATVFGWHEVQKSSRNKLPCDIASNLKAELYQGCSDAISSHQQNVSDLSDHWQFVSMVIVPSTFTGSSGQIPELYQDAISYIRLSWGCFFF